jgi:hypothetical protein
LDVRKVYANMVSRILMHGQKIMKENVHWPCWMNWEKLNIVSSVITGDESCVLPVWLQN